MIELQGPSAFGECLRDMRISRGLSQQMLAERANISVAAVCALERGRRHAPYPETLQWLTTALGLDGAGATKLADAASASQERRTRFRRRAAARNHDATRLPWYLSAFFGRLSETQALLEAIAAQRLVTVCGGAGVGKSRLVVQVATMLEEVDGKAVRYVDAGARRGGFHTLGVAASTEPQSRPWTHTLHAQIVKETADRASVLVLDNCESELEAVAGGVVTLLRACPNLRIIVASRQPLRIAGEFVVRITSLDEPAAEALFRDRARDNAVRLDDDQRVAAVCRKLDGVPLAIELAAGRLRVMSLGELDKTLDDPAMLLGCRLESRDRPVTETLRESIERSFAVLTAQECTMIRNAGSFAGAFELDEAAATLGLDRWRTLDVIVSLVEKAVLENDHSTSLYRMLGTTRSFVRELSAQQTA